MFTEEEIKLAPKTYWALKKIAWVNGKNFYIWDYISDMVVFYDNSYWFVWFVDPAQERIRLGGAPWRESIQADVNKCVPLLHWEKLEEILEDWGYTLLVGADHENRVNYYATIVSMGLCITKYGKTRQEAVMRAIIKLGEEVEK